MRSHDAISLEDGTGKQLSSPWLIGQQCMKISFKTFKTHASASIAVYANNVPLWIKSDIKRNTRQYTEIYYSSSASFQVYTG